MQKKSPAKRITAFFLAVVLIVSLLPMTLFSTAIFAEAETAPTVQPFYMVNYYRGITTNSFSNVYYMPKAEISTSAFNANSTQINMNVVMDGATYSDIAQAAKLMYDDFVKRPAGTRYLNLPGLPTVFNECVKDAIDFEDGIRLVSDWVDRFLTAYKALGGELDGIAVDLEYTNYTSKYLQTYFCTKYTQNGVEKEPRNLDILQDIVRNERVYQAKIRPQLEELKEQGLFQFYTKGINPETGLPYNLSDTLGVTYEDRVPIPTSELTTINRYDSDGGIASCASMWNTVLARHIVDCIDRAVYEPMTKHFPNAILSDYEHADTYSWNKGFSSTGGTTGTGAKAGNASNGVYYGSNLSEYFYSTGYGSSTRQLYYKPVGQNAAVYEPETPYSMALRDINNNKRIVASAQESNDKDQHTNVWIPYFHYASDKASYGNSAYYSELVYHLGLTNPEPFFGYIVKSEVESKGANYYPDDPNMGNYQYALGVTNELLAELTRVAGASDRRPIVTPIEWDNGFVVSGMYAGGRNIWRLTPDTRKVSVEDFKVKDKAPTFTVNGVTITFPQGRIIEDADITQIGTSGYWIETPMNVNPVITKSANHFEENPSFGDDFEGYIEGAFAGSSTSVDKTLHPAGYRPDTYWTVSGTANIVETSGDKALTLTGSTTLTNASARTTDSDKTILTVPSQITAGDYYAQQQAWEVTVTLPASNTYTNVTLFTFDDSDTSTTDAAKGIVLTGGNVKYYNGSTATTLSGVNLSAGGTFRFKRVLDLNTKKSSYYVYNAAGTLLGSAENISVSMSSITLPVASINISTTGATSAITLDNYKLYPVGVTATLDLYEEIALSQFADYTGIVRKVSDTSAARTTKTAYRVSWMNASNAPQTAVLKNKTTGNEIDRVFMAPGESGYFTGIVEASANAPVTFELTKVTPVSTDYPPDINYDNGDFTWTAENTGITCYIGNQGYARLEDALAAAKNNQTIVMIADAKMAATAVVDSSVKIQPYGHTISLADDFTGDSAITLAAGGNLNWEEGLHLNAGNKTAICVTGGTLNVTGGTIVSTGTAILVRQDEDKSPITVNVTGGSVRGGEKAFLHTNTNPTPTENVTIAIRASAITGAVDTTEENFVIRNYNGVYTLKVHTPGAKVELTEQRVNAAIELDQATGTYRVKSGKYVFQYTCSVCGETWTEEETFKPALLHYRLSTDDGQTQTTTFSGFWANNNGTSYKPQLVINPGEVYYFVTNDTNAKHPTNTYVRQLNASVAADKAIIDAGTWNMKFDYPVGSTPVLTMQGATINNPFGLWYGAYGYNDLAPLTIVLKGDNVINTQSASTSDSASGALNLRTNSDVTITGDGKLTLKSLAKAPTLRILSGDLILNHADVTVIKSNSSLADGVSAGGDIVINGGTFTLKGNMSNYEMTNGLNVAGNVTIQNGAVVTLCGGIGKATGTWGVINAKGDVTISESTLTIGNIKNAAQNIVCANIYTNYANGFTLKSQTTPLTTYSTSTGAYTYPSSSVENSVVTSTVMSRKYMYIAPKTPLVNFEASAVTVQDDLTLEFAIKAEKIPEGSIAYITRGETTTQVTLTDAYKEGDCYVIPCTGIAAKEMHDQVTMVIKSASSKTILSETRTDSIYNYIVRMLDVEQGEMTDAKYAALKTVLVDLLNYGTMAQVQFGHNTSKLANIVLTPSHWAYATTEMKATPAVSATVEGTAKHLGTTFELNTNIAMLIAVEGTVNSVKVYVGGVESEVDAVVTADNGYSIITFNGLDAADGRKEVMFVINNGATTVTDSLANYVGRNIAKYPYLENLMKYCDAAAAYFTAV